MVASLQIGTSASYYARGYYRGGERELSATWFARGRQFGLEHGGEIDIAVFERLHAGLEEHGASLLTTKGREVAGLDVCFSPGKASASPTR